MLGVIGVTLVLGFIEFLDPASFQRAVGFPVVAEQRGALNVVKSIFIHPALFAWFTAFAGLVLYAYFLVYRRWWLLLAAVVFSVGTVLSGRRRVLVGMLAALAAAGAWWLRARPSRRGVLVGAVPVGVSVLLLLVVTLPVAGSFYARTLDRYLPRIELLAGVALADQEITDAEMRTLHPRTALYATSLAVARDHLPLGAGLGRFGSPMSRSVYSPLYEEYRLTLVFGLSQDNPQAVTDTFWPMLLGETGPIGVAAYAAFLGVDPGPALAYGPDRGNPCRSGDVPGVAHGAGTGTRRFPGRADIPGSADRILRVRDCRRGASRGRHEGRTGGPERGPGDGHCE